MTATSLGDPTDMITPPTFSCSMTLTMRSCVSLPSGAKLPSTKGIISCPIFSRSVIRASVLCAQVSGGDLVDAAGDGGAATGFRSRRGGGRWAAFRLNDLHRRLRRRGRRGPWSLLVACGNQKRQDPEASRRVTHGESRNALGCHRVNSNTSASRRRTVQVSFRVQVTKLWRTRQSCFILLLLSCSRPDAQNRPFVIPGGRQRVRPDSPRD